MEKTLSFNFWTTMRECCGSNVGAKATVTLNEVDAWKFCILFDEYEQLSGEAVEQAVGKEIWSQLRKSMDDAIFRRMDEEYLYENEYDIQMYYDEEAAPDAKSWDDLTEEEKLEYVAKGRDDEADWGIAALDRPQLLD